MKVSIYDSASNIDNTFTSPGLTITGPLLLNGSVAAPLEAVHKQYVDTIVTSINAASVNNGTLPPGRLPALTGDISTTQGSNVLVLGNNGVTPGEYTKVTVDTKGRVGVGSTISTTDLPNFSWNKITTGKPTTLSGYGITDGISNVNGVISGVLTLSNHPVNINDIATKSYVDVTLNLESGINTGTIISSFTTTTPAGFLRCNGGQVSKTTYSALYSVIGDTFNFPVLPGSGRPWEQQYYINNSQNSNISSWDTGTFNEFTNSLIAVSKYNKMYAFNATSKIVYMCSINSDSTLTKWVNLNNDIPSGFINSISAIAPGTNGIYLIDVRNGKTCYAPFNSDGTLGSWVSKTHTFPVPTGYTSYRVDYFVYNNFIYIYGLYFPSAYYTGFGYAIAIDSLETGNWVTSLQNPKINKNALDGSSVTCYNNYVYMIGGTGLASNSASINYGTLNADGTFTSWSADIALPESSMVYAGLVATGGELYVIGSASSANIYKATINANGSLGAWSPALSFKLPYAGAFQCPIKTNKYVYLTKGVNYDTNSTNGNCFKLNINQTTGVIDGIDIGYTLPFRNPERVIVTKNKVYFLDVLEYGDTIKSGATWYATINPNGTLTGWTKGPNLQATVPGLSVVVTKSKVYLLGGSQSSTYSNRIYSFDIDANGLLSGLSYLGTLPMYSSDSQCIITYNRLYIIGGWSASNGVVLNCYYATIDNTGNLGSWVNQTTSTLPSEYDYREARTIVTKSRVYIIAKNNSNSSTAVLTTTIAADGSLSSWSLNTTLPETLTSRLVYVTRNKVYLFGGTNATGGYTNKIYTASINADGTLGTWTSTGNMPYSYLTLPGYTSINIFAVNKFLYLIDPFNNYFITSIADGLNDYSSYYNGTIVPTDSTNFRLPDYSLNETSNFNYYIKY